jgi:hypothetical protein
MRPIQAPETLFKIHILLLVITYTVCFIVEHNSLRTFSGQYHCGQLSSPGQMSLWANVSGQMSLWANVFSANVFIGECISWQRSFCAKVLWANVLWANVVLSKCLLGKCRITIFSIILFKVHVNFIPTVKFYLTFGRIRKCPPIVDPLNFQELPD